MHARGTSPCLRVALIVVAGMMLAPNGVAAQRAATTQRAATAQRAPADTLGLRVMTCNLRYPSRNDTGNLWVQDERRAVAVAMFKAYGPDILGVQEAYRTQLDYLLTNLPGYACVGRERYGAIEEEHAAILVRADRFMIEEAGTFWLSGTPDAPGSRTWWPRSHPRVVTWARLIHVPTARRLLVFNTHFPTGEAVDSVRVRAAALIWRRLRQQEDLPAILLGDFNNRPDGATYRLLTGEDPMSDGTRADFRDAWRVASSTSGPTRTSHGFRLTPGGEYAPPTRANVGTPTSAGMRGDAGARADARIDWILVRGPIRVGRVETVTYNRDGKYPSDHFPVAADIVLEGSGQEGR